MENLYFKFLYVFYIFLNNSNRGRKNKNVNSLRKKIAWLHFPEYYLFDFKICYLTQLEKCDNAEFHMIIRGFSSPEKIFFSLTHKQPSIQPRIFIWFFLICFVGKISHDFNIGFGGNYSENIDRGKNHVPCLYIF